MSRLTREHAIELLKAKVESLNEEEAEGIKEWQVRVRLWKQEAPKKFALIVRNYSPAEDLEKMEDGAVYWTGVGGQSKAWTSVRDQTPVSLEPPRYASIYRKVCEVEHLIHRLENEEGKYVTKTMADRVFALVKEAC